MSVTRVRFFSKSGLISSRKQTALLISPIIVVTLVDSQFINLFYASDFGTPGDFQLLLFLSFVTAASVINTILLFFVRSSDVQARVSRPMLFRIAYIGTLGVQYALLLIMAVIVSEMIFVHHYNKELSLSITYLSHLWAALVLGVLSFVFVQWLRFSRSFSILVCAVVFCAIIFLVLITIPLLTDQVIAQPPLVIPRDYSTLINAIIVPSPNIAFIYSLGNYVLPLLIISSWILTVSLLKPYRGKVGKKFWIIVSIPLLYQFFTFIVRDTNIVTNPTLVSIIYTGQFQLIFAINYQVSGLFFAIAFLGIARKIKLKIMKRYLIISAIGVVSLFSSVQPGLPFYAAYPPFGIVTLSFLGLSSYLLFVGILGCATYFSRDSEVRKEIYNNLAVDSGILERVGVAEMQREMEKRILPLYDKIDSSNEMSINKDIGEEDVKAMIHEVLNELHAKRSSTHSSAS